jgi:pyruvate,orthophosphate dikinase
MLQESMPRVYKELDEIVQILEDHYRDMQDIEFTIEHDQLWMLQTRSGKRTGFAACQIAVDLVEEGKVTAPDALTRLIPDANALDQLLKPVFDPESISTAKSEGRLMAKGLAAGPGAASGKVAFNAEDAVVMAAKGDPVVLVRVETSPEDIRGMEASQGILTARGGQTSHAALVARQMGKVCVAGCSDLVIDYARDKMTAGGMTVRAGDYLSIDGFTGEVFTDRVKVMPSEVKQALFGEGDAAQRARESHTFLAFMRLLAWADEYRKLGIWTNADQPDQAAEAVVYGAEGIGLCRTEHMFFGGDRILAVREMIVADDTLGREHALEKLLPYQRDDFIGILKAMGTRPVTVRLLDPPLHEFLPHSKIDNLHLARSLNMDPEVLTQKLKSLAEFNPMLGHRGCRLGITYPEIYMMQVRAIVEAAIQVRKDDGVDCRPEIMIPLVAHRKELAMLRHQAEDLIASIMSAEGVQFDVPIGTMIELPRAALTADSIATEADFFSFGTNDLTQTVFGLSRDDSGRFLPYYIEHGVLPDDPFVSIDQEGVGALVKIGIEKGRKANPDLKVGICGEHGGDPHSVHFFHRAGLNYVSCSPPRLPVAKLAAAQAAILDQ